MAAVLDASIVGCWLLPAEMHATADRTRALLLPARGSVPRLWWFEVRNLLLVAERRSRIDLSQMRAGLALLDEIPVDVDHAPDSEAMLDLARKHRLTVYDAAYLELARRKALPLATLDAALIAAANAEQVALV
ncbi:MAG TPA: type II toxin-antitoxin system VapC family toxin [Parvibaculum sp.]|jgi:predicted nucleic acid-binding protein